MDANVEGPPTTPKRRRPARRILAVSSGFVTLFLALLFLVPMIPTTASGSLQRYVGCTFCPAQNGFATVSLPLGATVHVDWAEVHHRHVWFALYGQRGQQAACAWYNDTSGTSSFVAVGGPYSLFLAEPLAPGPGHPSNLTTLEVNWTLQYARPPIAI